MLRNFIYLNVFILILIGLSCASGTDDKKKVGADIEKSDVKAKGTVKEDLHKDIIEMEKRLFQDAEADTALAKKMIDKYLNFANEYPRDTSSAEFLFKAAEIAMNIGLGTRAINYLSRIDANYRDFSKHGTSLFLIAHIYHTQLGNTSKAEKFYQKFIEKYPNHALKEDAKASLMFLDFDDQALIEAFQQMN